MNSALNESLEMTTAQTAHVLRRALSYVAPFRKQVLVKLGLLTLSLLPNLFLPWPIKIIIDHVIEAVPIGQEVRPYPFFVQPLISALQGASQAQILAAAVVIQAILLFVIGAFGATERDALDGDLATGQDTATQTENQANRGSSYLGGLLGLFEYRYTIRLTQALNHHYRSRLYERMKTLPMRTFDDERIGDAVYRVMYDTPAITDVCYRLLLTPIASPLNIVLTVSVLASVYGKDSPIVLLATLFLPLVLIATWPFTGVLRRASARSRNAGSTTTTTIEEGMSNITAVQSLGGEGRERKRFDRDSRGSFRAFRRLAMTALGATLTAGIFGGLLVAWVFLYIGDEIIAGRLSVGDVGVLIPYFSLIATSSVNLGALWIRVQSEAAGLNRVFWLMDLPAERDANGATPLSRVREAVRVEGLAYEYEAGQPVLREVSFEAKVGQITAFVGPAGAGKTTLAYMLPRFLTPARGRVLIDGTDIAAVTLASLRRQIAFVFQETTLFDTTIAENLRLGNPEANDQALERATRTAGIYEFIVSLPEGFHTRLGRAGGKLSVGQKQRLSIARALVCDAPILIFDEPTSALDPETEARLVKALEAASRDRVVIVIAHRLSTIRNAGQILFLQDGEILERGSHAVLMERPDGPYRRFVELQTRGV